MESSAWSIAPLLMAFAFIVFGGDASPSAGFRAELSRVDANSNFSKMELIGRAVQRSHRRLAQLTTRSSSKPKGASSACAGCYSAPVHAGEGEYLMDLAVGTPKVAFSAIVDTGSDLIWMQCEPCLHCIRQTTPFFRPAKSSTYSNLSCNDRLCTAPTIAACSSTSGNCGYLYAYGDTSFTKGVLATDTLSIGSTAVPAVAFGCGQDNQDGGGNISLGSGLVGLGRGPLSLISQLNLSRFSYCLTSMDESKASPFLFGELAKLNACTAAKPNACTTAKLVRNAESPSTYYLSLKGISVGGKLLAIPKGAFELQRNGDGGVFIDSGTTITYLEEAAYNAVKRAFSEGLKLPAADGANLGLDACFKPAAGVKDVEVPSIVLHFDRGDGGSAGGDLELPADNYAVFDSTSGLLCLAMMKSTGISILGNFLQQNFHVLYDLEKEVVSFEPTKCHLL